MSVEILEPLQRCIVHYFVESDDLALIERCSVTLPDPHSPHREEAQERFNELLSRHGQPHAVGSGDYVSRFTSDGKLYQAVVSLNYHDVFFPKPVSGGLLCDWRILARCALIDDMYCSGRTGLQTEKKPCYEIAGEIASVMGQLSLAVSPRWPDWSRRDVDRMNGIDGLYSRTLQGGGQDRRFTSDDAVDILRQLDFSAMGSGAEPVRRGLMGLAILGAYAVGGCGIPLCSMDPRECGKRWSAASDPFIRSFQAAAFGIDGSGSGTQKAWFGHSWEEEVRRR